MNDTDPASPGILPDDEPPRARLKVMALVKQTYATVFGNYADMVKIVWVALFLQAVSYMVPVYMIPGFDADPRLGMGTVPVSLVWGSFFIGLVMLLILAAVCVAVLRYVLAGQKPTFPGFGIGGRELRFFGYQLVFYVILFVAWAVSAAVLMTAIMVLSGMTGSSGFMGSTVVVAGYIAMLILMIMVTVRLSFVFPALAVDREGGVAARFKHAWRSARGHTATMVVALIVALLPWVIVFYIGGVIFALWAADDLMQGGELSGGFLAFSMFNAIMGWLQIILFNVLFAHAYATLEAAPQSTVALDEA